MVNARSKQWHLVFNQDHQTQEYSTPGLRLIKVRVHISVSSQVRGIQARAKILIVRILIKCILNNFSVKYSVSQTAQYLFYIHRTIYLHRYSWLSSGNRTFSKDTAFWLDEIIGYTLIILYIYWRHSKCRVIIFIIIPYIGFVVSLNFHVVQRNTGSFYFLLAICSLIDWPTPQRDIIGVCI